MSIAVVNVDQYKLSTKFRKRYKEHTITCESGTRTERWIRDRLLGSGNFGAVWLEKEGKIGAFRAVKQMTKTHTLMNKRELQALIQLKEYPQHFVQFFGWFENEENIYLAMEYMPLGDLAGLIPKGGMAESSAKIIVEQLLEGLKIMHDNKFCHRDLKPANILIASWTPSIIVKISDFGISKQEVDGTAFRTQIGTPAYAAPEVRGILPSRAPTYTSAADMWSFGCLTHFLMTGETPFSELLLFQYIEKRSAVSFPEIILRKSNASQTAINFITSLVRPLPENRLTVDQALQHQWLNTGGQEQEQEQDRDEPGFLEKEIIDKEESLDEEEISDEEEESSDEEGESSSRETTVESGLGQDKITPNSSTAIQINPFLEEPKSGTQTILHNCTTLHCAAKHGNLGITNLLLVNGADIMAKDSTGWSALHRAAYNGHKNVANLLLVNGADIMAKDNYGWSALHHAAHNGHENVVNLLLVNGADIMAKSNNGWSALHRAAYNGRENVANLLLVNRADIMAKDSDGRSALHHAARNGHENVANLLLVNGADIMAKDSNGQSVLHHAAYNGHKNVANLLLVNGADIMAKSNNGWSALHYAAYNGHENVANLLLVNGADIMAKDSNGRSAHHHAARNGHENVANLLLVNGADIMAKDNDGWSALHYAAYNGHENVANLLLVNGADTMAKDNDGRSALHYAAYNGHENVANLLLVNGADTMAKGNDGRSALDHAARNGHKKVKRLLQEAQPEFKTTFRRAITRIFSNNNH